MTTAATASGIPYPLPGDDLELGAQRIQELADHIDPRVFPAAGTQGQVLVKQSDTDYDAGWTDVAAGSEVSIGTVDPLPTEPTSELWLDTTTDPPILKANLAGAWEPISTESQPEVHVGPEDPYATIPGTLALIWFDTSQDPPILKVRVADTWESIAEHNEIAVTTTDPRTVAGSESAAQLWFDPSALLASPPRPPILIWDQSLAVGAGAWQPVGTVPPGGTTGQVLAKATNDDYRAVWQTPPPPKLGGVLPAFEYNLAPSPGRSTSSSHADHAHGTPPEEVVVSTSDPAPANPRIEIWYDPSGASSNTQTLASLAAEVRALRNRIAVLERKVG